MEKFRKRAWLLLPVALALSVTVGLLVMSVINAGRAKKSEYTVVPVSGADFTSEDAFIYVPSEVNGRQVYVLTQRDASSSSGEDGGSVRSDETAATGTNATTTANPEDPDKTGRVAYLTFDDGPSVNTEKILDVLDRYHVKATFFVVYHKGMDSRYKAIVERGHTIALHSYSHRYEKIYASEEAYFQDLQKIHDFVQETTGVDSRIIRFPGGSSNTVGDKYQKGIMTTLRKAVTKKGYTYHDWNVDSTDARGSNRATDVLLENVKKDAEKHKRINILMHDAGKTKQTTVEALPSIIEYLQVQGFDIQPLTEDSKAIRHA